MAIGVTPPDQSTVGASVALVFPGQGTQREGMGAPWRDAASWSLVSAISEQSGHDVEELLLSTEAEVLRRTDLAQTAVFSTCMVALGELRHAGVPATVVACAGHSLGEYAALVAAGALSLADGAALVAARGAAMLEAARRRPGTMAVVAGVGAGELEDLCAEARRGGSEVWVANMNAPGQVVVSGTSVGVAAVAALASPLGFKLVPLPVGGGFHSPLMEDALPALRQALSAVTFADHHVPVVANVDGLPHREGRRWPELAARQLTSPVLWERSVRWLAGRVPGPLVELGPGRTLAGMVRRISPTTEVTSVSSPADAASLAGSLTGRAGGKVPRGRETQRCPTV